MSEVFGSTVEDKLLRFINTINEDREARADFYDRFSSYIDEIGDVVGKLNHKIIYATVFANAPNDLERILRAGSLKDNDVVVVTTMQEYTSDFEPIINANNVTIEFLPGSGINAKFDFKKPYLFFIEDNKNNFLVKNGDFYMYSHSLISYLMRIKSKSKALWESCRAISPRLATGITTYSYDADGADNKDDPTAIQIINNLSSENLTPLPSDDQEGTT